MGTNFNVCNNCNSRYCWGRVNRKQLLFQALVYNIFINLSFDANLFLINYSELQMKQFIIFLQIATREFLKVKFPEFKNKNVQHLLDNISMLLT